MVSASTRNPSGRNCNKDFPFCKLSGPCCIFFFGWIGVASADHFIEIFTRMLLRGLNFGAVNLRWRFFLRHPFCNKSPFCSQNLVFFLAGFHFVEQNQIITTEWMAQGDLWNFKGDTKETKEHETKQRKQNNTKQTERPKRTRKLSAKAVDALKSYALFRW